MPTVTIIHGKQTYKTNSSKINVFVMECNNTQELQFPNKVLEQVKGTYSNTPASSSGYKDNGAWYTNRYNSKEGEILLLQVSTTYHGSPYSNGALFVRLRHSASLLSIKVIQQYNSDAVYNEVPVFIGNADILTLEEVAQHNIVLRSNYINNYLDEEEISELFRTTTLSAGTSKPSLLTVRTPDGNTRKVEKPSGSSRRIRIRSK